ncbi:glycosyltransferase [Leisingera sp. S132]|uniref:glycosyltransferase family 2 protein n=1 Tax=Leisingera sp. S132 TaxID=2867016 RepID=UPI0021A5D99E|nr:glycosyltransferase family 2 protein [Leisingera sp. S132]UWQ78062.1 glycosyltransferase [Leisingera sp. S132]
MTPACDHFSDHQGHGPQQVPLVPLLRGRTAWSYHALIAAWAVAALWFWGWWFLPEHQTSGIQYWVATAGLGWLFFLQMLFVIIFRRAMVPAGDPPDPASARVAMIVTKTPSEPFSVLKTTLSAMLAQSYPHDTWLADEDPDPETIAWCEARGVRISTRRGRADYHRKEWPRRTRCKEGNLAFFYDTYGYENYDFVSQLDADHVPSPNYLTEIMRGFSSPAVGYVSAPSICARNAGQSWAARTRLHTEAAFHGVFQAGYAAVLAPMCIGSHYAVRTKALRSVGGLGPELAEDHSTTMLMNAGGWQGVHAFNAIAEGDGPANIADLCTQEFQWSRSLLTIFLQFTSGYFTRLTPRLKFLFLFCQLFYPMFAGFMALLYLLPVLALLFDFRYAEVTYPAFILHAAPQILVLTVLAYRLKADGYFRPADCKVISWEKTLFLGIQWPWVLWGCVMAVRDKIAGGFVDFRITPKGDATKATLPGRIIAVYAALALGCFLPILLVDSVREAHGFYLLASINGMYYAVITAVIVGLHYRSAGGVRQMLRLPGLAKMAVPLSLFCMAAVSVNERGMESLYALSKGLEPYRIIREEYAVAGAGMGGPGTVILIYDPGRIDSGPGNDRE